MEGIASSSSKLPRKYDVLINFNGEDIQRTFVSHLDSALSAVGLTTFLHHPNAVNPIHIQQPILNHSRVAIVVFTKAYSQSEWCLHQLQQIIKWHQTYCRHVLPVYYEIQPSDVRLQKGDFGKAFKATAEQAFSGQELVHGMSRWSHALTKAANFFGWDESNYRSDAELVDKIVKTVLHLPVLSATQFPVGLQSHVQYLIGTIQNNTEVYTIGITGEEGSGKTTLAKAIYNQLSATFTEKTFIEDIAHDSETRPILRLDKQLLLDVLKTKVEIPRGEMGRIMIRERLSGKRVLIVLDDVPEFDASVVSECLEWFSGGTVIIITTRDVDLPRILQVDSVFPLKPMNANESLELLSWHAFGEAKPKEEYNYLAKSVVSRCGGLPLALEVIGSCLFERTKEEWNSVLLKLEKIPLHDIQRKLKVSFDGLRNEMEKDLFLDICCSFFGKGRAYVTKILNGCGVDADTGIRVLIERSFIKIKKNNKLGMHPLLQKMGEKIIREKSKEEFWMEMRRLQFDDAEYVVTDNSGRKSWTVPVKLRSVRREPSRLLLKLAGSSEYTSKKLRWISLQRCFSECVLEGFHLHDAIGIHLKHIHLRLLLLEPQVFRWLKVLNLTHSMYLIQTPDFSGLPRLEQLILKDCPRLRKVHQSIGGLSNLTLLNLKDCTSLRNLPRKLYTLKSLKTLILSGCSMIDLLEIDTVQMESLITLITENTAVKQVPFSIVRSKSIGYISLRGFERLPRNLFPSIIRSWMSPTTISISYINSFCMDKEDNSWDDITPLLSSLTSLRSVLVQCDTEFQLCEQVKNILVEYFATNTESGISKQHFRSSLIGVGAYHEFFNAVSHNVSKVTVSSESCDDCLPVDNDPYWLGHMGEEHSVSFTVPLDRDLKGMVLCVVYSSTPEIDATECLRSVLIVNYTKCTLHIHKHGTVISFNYIDWQGILSNLGSGDKVEIFLSFGRGLVVKNTVVYPICGEPNYLRKEPKENSLLRFIKKIVM